MALLTGDELNEIAIRLEERSTAFYEGVAETATSTSIKCLFHQLVEQEAHHRCTFQEMDREAVELALSPDQWTEKLR